MKKLTLYIPQIITMFFLLMILGSCGKSEMEPGGAFDCDTDQLRITTEAYLAAENAYALDASIENCISYKAAAEAYLVNVRKCTLTGNNGIQETEELIESLDC